MKLTTPTSKRLSRRLATVLMATLIPSGWLNTLGVRFAHAEEQAKAKDAAIALVLTLDASLGISAEKVRTQVQKELGCPVLLVEDAPGGRILVQQQDARVLMQFDAPDGHYQRRVFELPADPNEAARIIGMLAVNLVRDQTAQFVGPKPAAPAAPAAPAPCGLEGPRTTTGFDLAPGFGTSSTPTGRASRRDLSIGLLGTLSAGSDIFALSAGVSVATRSQCGLGIAGGANIVTGPVAGAQIAPVNVAAGQVQGLQLGPFNYAGGADGAQVGAVNVSSGTVQGVQVGAVNVTPGIVHGLQIGAVNIVEKTDFSLGALNIIYGGRFKLDLWALPDSGLLFAGVKNGGDHFHYIYAIGARDTDTHPVWVAFGIGAHITPTEHVFIDLDAVVHGEVEVLASGANGHNVISQIRAVAAYPILPGLAAYAGPTLNILYAGNGAPSLAPGYSTHLTDSSTAHVELWPGLALGMEAL